MAQDWFGAFESPMRRKNGPGRSCFGVTVSLNIFAILVFVIGPSFATGTDIEPPTSKNGHDCLFAKGDSFASFPYPLGSFSGLSIDREGVKPGEPQGLDLVTRASDDRWSLGNNRFGAREILMGELQQWSFAPDAAASNSSDAQIDDPSKRVATAVYLSLTICSGPSLKESLSNTAQALPQLVVYVSTSDSLRDPGPHHKDGSGQTVYHSSEGYMSATLNAASDVYIAVAAPSGGNFSGSYSYQIAASTDDFFHNVDDHAALLSFDDSGSETALLATVSPADQILTEEQRKQWENNTTVYKFYVNNANSTVVSGLSRSYCALAQHSQASNGHNVQASMFRRRRETDGLQEQFYVTGLNRSSTYVGILAMGNSGDSGDGLVGGGGKVWKPKSFSTKSDGNCDVIYDLDFCSDVAYSVPSNPSMSMSEIRTKYDNYAANLYKKFNYSLQQIQCNTSNETIYSMAVGCDDCAAAYKSWLCAVTIPRCDDYSSTSNRTAVMVRNAAQPFPNGTEITNQTLRDSPVTNRPRNSGLIDKEINPGPYKEVLPNISFCHDLVRSCPMSLGFSCPSGKYLAYSYDISVAPSLRVPYPLGAIMTAYSVIVVVFHSFS
ncbi:stretch-activated Ca2+-permeable channel component-domain-containing protein [Aspergillus desertorum]